MKSVYLRNIIASNAISKILKSEEIVELSSAELENLKLIIKGIKKLPAKEMDVALKKYELVRNCQSRIDNIRLNAMKLNEPNPKEEVEKVKLEYNKKWKEL